MTTEEKLQRWVIEPYRGKRDFYHSQKYYCHAREFFYRLVEAEKPESILDVGCGHALDSIPLMKLGVEYVGVDPVAENVEQARADNPAGDFRVGFMQETGMAPGSFDWVWVSSVWEILPSVGEMKRGIDECMRVARQRVYVLDWFPKPPEMTERYTMIPAEYGLSITRVNYNPEKKKADYLWCIDKTGIPGSREHGIS